ncbi:p21-activated protein kinase-interacting protein 1-like [Diachasmimorpha longicaudata]|uniref:p21-activated protein kinase-interacting protein 1-like n=1 Tax=Diachasmimorpha longicaudata TaxID=58733 RepID=UPI0030B90CE5
MTLFEVIVGTYEQFLLGYKVEKVEKKCKLERSFATHSHLASVRTVTARKHYLASGGADDSIYLYDMKQRTETGKLMHHDGTVNCVAFTPDATHLLSCGNDGSIGIVRCGNWQLEKHWKAPHKGSAVNTLSVHPTGKLALSIGADGVLRTWNLVKGRQAYATNLISRFKYDAKYVNIVLWSPDGTKYLIACNTKLDVYSVETAGISAEENFPSKIVSVDFLNQENNELVVLGHEDGKLRIYNIEDKSLVLETDAHETRIKCIQCRDNYIVSASSSGELKLWKFVKGNLKKLGSANCDARITCMTII